MLNNSKKLFYLIIIIVTLTGCSTKGMLNGANGKTGAAEKSGQFFANEKSDRELFEEAVFYLRNQEKEQNYQEARNRLQMLVEKFPQSNWITGAKALMVTLDRIFILQAALKKEKLKSKNGQEKLVKEIEGLRANVKHLEEKNSTAIVKLQQENEQLKKDIQQLKDLEIQLERREKMLR